MKNNEEFCPQCPNRCNKNELRCGRGRAYFNLEGEENSHKNRPVLTGIAGLLKQCGHIMHHNPEVNNEMLCKGLSQEEQKTLENLLNKVISNVK